MEAVFEVLHGPFCARGRTYQQGDKFSVDVNAAKPYFDCIMRGPQPIIRNCVFDDPVVQILAVLFFPITILVIFYYSVFGKSEPVASHFCPVPIRLVECRRELDSI